MMEGVAVLEMEYGSADKLVDVAIGLNVVMSVRAVSFAKNVVVWYKEGVKVVEGHKDTVED